MELSFMKKRAIAGAVGAAAMLLTGGTQAALQDRDLDGNGVTDAFYDTDLDITWLRDADVTGPMDWAAAVAWTSTYVIGGVGGWRLPVGDACSGLDCTGSEMGHLYYVELGNPPGGPFANKGSFQNIGTTGSYWTGTEVDIGYVAVRSFFFGAGFSGLDRKESGLNAMAVHNGDVGLVPEPETYALMLAGLAALALARRQRRR